MCGYRSRAIRVSAQGGAIYNPNDPKNILTVTNSTFSENTAGNLGGGIFNNGFGSAIITNSTFSGNSGSQGGDIYNNVLPPYTGKLTLINTILANVSSGGNCRVNQTNATDDSRNNLIEDAGTTCGLTDGVNGNIIGQDPQLGPLRTRCIQHDSDVRLISCSPAIDAGSATGCPQPISEESRDHKVWAAISARMSISIRPPPLSV